MCRCVRNGKTAALVAAGDAKDETGRFPSSNSQPGGHKRANLAQKEGFRLQKKTRSRQSPLLPATSAHRQRARAGRHALRCAFKSTRPPDAPLTSQRQRQRVQTSATGRRSVNLNAPTSRDQKLNTLASAAMSIRWGPPSRTMLLWNLASSSWRFLAQGVQMPTGTSFSTR